jgi:chromosome segregation ATPase
MDICPCFEQQLVMTTEERILQVVLKIHEDVTVLKEDVAVLKEDVAVLKKDVAVLKEKVDVLEARFDVLEEKVDTLDEKLGETRNNVIRFEQDAKSHWGALFDSFGFMLNAVQEIRKDNAVMHTRLESHELKLRFLGDPKIASAQWMESEERAERNERLAKLEQMNKELRETMRETSLAKKA